MQKPKLQDFLQLTVCFLHLARIRIAHFCISLIIKNMKRVLYLLVQCTWGLGQTILGLFFFLKNIRRPHRFYRCAIETQWENKYAGLSLGPFIFTPDADEDYYKSVRTHEYGHTFQSLMLGPFYALVGIVSCSWGMLIHPILKKTKNKELPYTTCFVEYWASHLGEKVTGEKAIW